MSMLHTFDTSDLRFVGQFVFCFSKVSVILSRFCTEVKFQVPVALGAIAVFVCGTASNLTR